MKNDRLNIMEGSTPSKTEKVPAHKAGAGNVEAPATPGVMPPRGNERKKKLWMMVRTWTDWNPIRELPAANGLKEEAVGTIGEEPPRRKTEPREDESKCSPQKKKRRYACRLFGTNSLKKGAM
jgi:hypothetical protein